MFSKNLFNSSSGLTELCFDKDEFMKTKFSVDDFLHEHRNAASLEVMRDDLGLYLKSLRLSMIELINQDYGDFVNLSNKLVGLHEYITNIRKSLENLQVNIYDIKILLDSIMNEISECLEEKKSLLVCKKNIRSLIKVQISIVKLIDLLDNQNHNNNNNNGNCVGTESSIILERSSLELMQSQFHAKYCSDFLNDDLKMKVDELNKKFLNKMRTYFLNILSNHLDNDTTNNNNNNNNNNTNDLEQCLRIYASLDKFDVAENVFREIVSNYMEQRITETNLQNSRNGLSDIYTEILNFISIYMKDILLLTLHTDKIKGFNFLINSYWIDVEHKIEMQLSSIFAPGNPEKFYINYKCTENFLNKFETILNCNENLLKTFRKHKSTKNFMNRWNLPVYFQIRFQEIAGPIENLCWIDDNLKDHKSIMNVFTTITNNIMKCWSDNIYIDKLFSKFFKLTLQIISRLCKFIENYLQNIKNHKINDTATATDIIEPIIYLYLEIYKFLNKLKKFIDIIYEKIPKDSININSEEKNEQFKSLIMQCFNDAKNQLNDLLRDIEKNILTKIILSELDKNIRQVGDIPRLYRKTNRDIPNKPSTYIQNVINGIDDFIKKFDSISETDKINEIVFQIFEVTTEKYCNAVQEVLTSVQKTEESLKRLKSLREKTTIGNSKNSPERTAVCMSDDDKIRLQLQLDVLYWHDNITKNGLTTTNMNKLKNIIGVLEDVTKIKTMNM